ncbi:MAG: peptide deformylase [Candidatus Nanopelagicales bacterium]
MVNPGQIHPIVQVGDPVLATRCRTVTDFDESLRQLVADMFASMYAADGVGLAANQIGIDLRVFVYDCPDADGRRQKGVVINPSLRLPELADRRLDDSEEGCLSLKGQYTALARPDLAWVEGVDDAGQPVSVAGTGLLARCLQHECDHLEGMMFIDRLPAKTRRKLLRRAE